MSNLIFDQQNDDFMRSSQRKSRSTLAGFLVRHSGGLIKDERMAEYVLLGICAIACVAALYVGVTLAQPHHWPPPTPPKVHAPVNWPSA